MGNEKIFTSRWQRLRRVFEVAFVFLVATGFLLYSKEKLALLLSCEGANHFPRLHLSVLLVIAVLILIIQWIRANNAEIQMLEDHFREFIPALPSSSFHCAVVIAVLLGVLVYLSDRIVAFSGVFLSYNLLTIWGNWLVSTRLRQAIRQGRSHGPDANTRASAWQAIEAYYLGKPQLKRMLAIVLFSIAALLLGVFSSVYARRALGPLLLYGAYAVMILNIVISEAVISIWRRERDRAIGEAYTF